MTDFKPFRDKLHDHTMPVPGALWDRIEANLPEPRRRRIAPWFWMTLLGGVLLGGLIVYSALELTPDLKTPALEQPALPAADEQALAPSTAPTGIQGPVVSSPESPESLEEGKLITASEQKLDLPNTASGHSKKPKSHTAAGSTFANSGQNPPGNPVMTGSSLAGDPPVEETVSFGPASIAVASDPAQQDLLTVPLDLRFQGISSPAPVIPRMRKPRFKTDIHCYKFSKNTGNLVWSADLFGGPGLSPRTLTDTGAESSVYAHARQTTEQGSYAWHAGGRLNLQLRSGLTFAAGLEYARVGDVFDYTDTLATQSTTRIDSFFAADGTFLYADTNRILVLGTLIKKIHNTYSYLDIPLLAGFEIPLKRSMLTVHAGPVLNIVTRQDGEILDPALHPRSIDPGRADHLAAYRSSLGLSLYIGGGLLFPLTQNLSALVEPRLIYRITPVTVDGFPVTEKRHLAGLSLGVRYHFIKS